MIDLYYWTTPNGHKLTIFLEEAGLEYEIKPVNIAKGEQFAPEFLAISPNNRIPALVDHAPEGGGEPLSLFESGAMLQYLAEKTGRFMAREPRRRWETIVWVTWQVANLGPMAGQNHHFRMYAPEKVPYAIDRYTHETERLYGILDDRLETREFIVGDDYGIADMACYPWARGHEKQGQDIDAFPHLKRWLDAIAQRPAVMRAYDIAKEISAAPVVDEAAKKVLFGQRRRTKSR